MAPNLAAWSQFTSFLVLVFISYDLSGRVCFYAFMIV